MESRGGKKGEEAIYTEKEKRRQGEKKNKYTNKVLKGRRDTKYMCEKEERKKGRKSKNKRQRHERDKQAK